MVNSTRTFVPVVIDVASVLLGIGVDDVELLLLDTGHVHPSSVKPYTLTSNRESKTLLEMMETMFFGK